MKHDNFDEIVLHIGNDPNNPEDLGADMTCARAAIQRGEKIPLINRELEKPKKQG